MAWTRRLAAIMVTDIVGSTAAAQRDEKVALDHQVEHERLLRPIFPEYGGREIKSTGDGFLVEFDSALRATECAVAIQRALRERNRRRGDDPFSVRIGLHLGDVEQREGDIFGDAVNIASRIEPFAEPGGVCLSEPVYAQVRNKVGYEVVGLGPKSLKGVQNPLEIYRVVLPWSGGERRAHDLHLPRLAVLPLANISPDPKDEYFADGLTEELIATLSRLPGLRVIARTSVGKYKSTSKSIGEVGAELGVQSVLEGSVRKSQDQLRITLQLIDVQSEAHRWAQTFDRTLDKVFSVQEEVAERTAEALKLELLREDRDAIHPGSAPNPAAYDLYLRGRAKFGISTTERLSSIQCFEDAIRTDPSFALAYSALANALIAMSGEHLPSSETLPRARELVRRALDLDPNLSDTHTAVGNLALQADQDWELAEAELRAALALNPSSSEARFWYGLLLVTRQRYDEAREQFHRATELNPDHEPCWVWLGLIDYLVGNPVACIERAKKCLGRFPTALWPYVLLALGHAQLGSLDAASRAVELAGEASGQPEVLRATLLPRLGREEDARRLLSEWDALSKSAYVPLENLAALRASLGQRNDALEMLERDFREGERALWFTYQFGYYDDLRDEPRFRALLERYRLPTDAPPRLQKLR